MRAKTIVAVLLLTVAAARANPCPVPNGATSSLGAIDGETRLRFLRSGLRYSARKARIWAWSSAGVLLAVGNFQVLGALNVPDRGDRIDLWVGAASLTFSLLQIAAVVPLVTIDQFTLERHVAHAAPGADRCALLAEAERFLLRDAKSEAIGTGAAMQAVTVIFNIGTGALLGIAFNRWTSAASNIVAGAILGEVQILTQPTLSMKLLDRYRAGDLSPIKGEKPVLAWSVVPTATRESMGLSLALSF